VTEVSGLPCVVAQGTVAVVVRWAVAAASVADTVAGGIRASCAVGASFRMEGNASSEASHTLGEVDNPSSACAELEGSSYLASRVVPSSLPFVSYLVRFHNARL